jgi:hypothetical protein
VSNLTLFLAIIAAELGIFLFLYKKSLPRHFRTTSIGIRFTNSKGVSKMADLSLQVGQSSTGTVVPFLADGVTQTPGATVSAQVWTLSDPAITVTNNPDGTVTVLGVSPTTAPISGSVEADVTDSDALVTHFTATFSVTVGGGVVNRTASIGVNWSSPS